MGVLWHICELHREPSTQRVKGGGGGARKRIDTYSILEPQERQSRSCSLLRPDNLCPPTECEWIRKKQRKKGMGQTLRLGTFRTLSGYFFTYFFLPLLEWRAQTNLM